MMTPEVIALLTPKSDTHEKLLRYCLERLRLSERKMSIFHPRWQANELRAQAYLTLPKYEEIVKSANQSGKPPQVVSVVVPYGFSTCQSICTFLIHTFCGRKPIFPVGAYNDSQLLLAQDIEKVLDYNANHTRLVKHFWQFFNDIMNYGTGVLWCEFETEQKLRSRWRASSGGLLDQLMGASSAGPVREKMTVYEGNIVKCIDPFCFFPDPRVSMSRGPTEGEWVSVRSFEGRMALRKMEREQIYIYTSAIPTHIVRNSESDDSESYRNRLALGEQPGSSSMHDPEGRVSQTIQIDNMVVELIPKDFGLSDVDTPVKWIVTIANKGQIVRAEEFIADHDRLPYVVSEPYALGYGFGQPGLMDYLSPLQDLMSWMVNSHMFNVRAALNNQFLVDPSMVEMQDLTKTDPGKIIRLKRSAYGQDVRAAFQQLAVADVTKPHMQDLRVIMALADMISGINDNLRGQQESGGRKTATEVRQSSEAGASRLVALARLISGQAITDLAEMQCLNIQQFMSLEFFLKLCGKSPMEHLIRPDMEVADFYFPIHDGTLPLDKVALFDLWQQLFTTTLQDPQLRMTYDIAKIFEHIAKLGGAGNIEDFRLIPNAGAGGGMMPMLPQLMEADPGAIAQGVQAGNVVPFQQPTAGVA